MHAGPERSTAANDRHGAGDVERARHDLVHLRLARRAEHAIDGGEQLGERQRERRLRRRGRLRQVRARESIASLFAATLEHVHHFAHLLVLEQPAHELGARIFPRLLVAAAAAASAP